MLQGGELFSRVGSKNYELTEEKCKKFVVEIVKGLNYVHSQEIVHLDIKPQNIMLVDRKEDFRLKLIDFGLAKRLIEGRVRIGFAGTVGFMAPEVAHCQYGQNYEDLASPATDMFSLGVVVYMLVSGGREPFWDVNDIRTIRNTVRRDPSFNFNEFENISENAKNFIRGKVKPTWCHWWLLQRIVGEASEEETDWQGVFEASLAGRWKTSCAVCQDTPQAGDNQDEKAESWTWQRLDYILAPQVHGAVQVEKGYQGGQDDGQGEEPADRLSSGYMKILLKK